MFLSPRLGCIEKNFTNEKKKKTLFLSLRHHIKQFQYRQCYEWEAAEKSSTNKRKKKKKVVELTIFETCANCFKCCRRVSIQLQKLWIIDKECQCRMKFNSITHNEKKNIFHTLTLTHHKINRSDAMNRGKFMFCENTHGLSNITIEH